MSDDETPRCNPAFGGLADLRTASPPAEGYWWLDPDGEWEWISYEQDPEVTV